MPIVIDVLKPLLILILGQSLIMLTLAHNECQVTGIRDVIMTSQSHDLHITAHDKW